MDRRKFMCVIPAAALLSPAGIASAAPGKKGVMLMNRIAPSVSELLVANSDGSEERKFLDQSAYDYNASLSPGGDRVIFTSERNGDGKSDLFMCRPDGTGITSLVVTPSMDDAGAVSPDGRFLAFVSTRNGYRANI